MTKEVQNPDGYQTNSTMTQWKGTDPPLSPFTARELKYNRQKAAKCSYMGTGQQPYQIVVELRQQLIGESIWSDHLVLEEKGIFPNFLHMEASSQLELFTL